jgi:hypothetical protein
MRRIVNRKVLFGLFLMFVFLLSSCDNSTNMTLDLSAMDAYIDPEIQGKEREVMREILNALPENARADVVHLNDDGTLYTNRVANKGKGKVIKKEGNSNVWMDQAGNPYPLSLPTPQPSPFAQPSGEIEAQAYVTPQCKLDGTGIEFRMHSQPGKKTSSVPALGGAEVDVFAPSKASGKILVEDPSGFGCTNDRQSAYGETAYVYLGGWGGVSMDSRVDAGLQFNCATATTGSYSDYTLALFFSYQTGPTSFMAVNDAFANRFKAGQKLVLTYQVSGTNTSTNPVGNQTILYVRAYGLPATGGTLKVAKTITTSNNGWDLSGQHNILSLSASVAQTPQKSAGDYWVSAAPNPLSKFGGITFSSLELLGPRQYTDSFYNFYSWNSYSYSDPLTDTAARNGICRAPSANTTSIDPIEVSGSSTATTTGITVDLLVKK